MYSISNAPNLRGFGKLRLGVGPVLDFIAGGRGRPNDIYTGFGGFSHEAANQAQYFPIVIDEPIRVAKVAWVPSAANGDIDVGIYNPAGTRMFSTGALAVGAINTVQSASMDFKFNQGLYYVGVSFSLATGGVYGTTVVNADHVKQLGMFEEDSAHPLPATATFAARAGGTLRVHCIAFFIPGYWFS